MREREMLTRDELPSLQELARAVVARDRRWGILFQAGGLWIGAHYSRFNRRWCVNLVPCVTIWFTLPGGSSPRRATES